MTTADGADQSARRTRLYRTEGIILRRRDLGEADRILTIYTERYGKLRVVAKGVRKTTSRLAGHIEPFSRASLLIAQGRNLDIITQASMIDPFKALRSDETAIAYAGYFADLLDALTEDAEENPLIYRLIHEALGYLDQGADPFISARLYELRLLRLIGVQPELYQCIVCGRTLDPVVNGFSADGGVVCEECRSRDPAVQSLSVNGLKFLRLLDRGDTDTAFRLRLSPELAREIEEHLRTYVRNNLQRDLSSLAVLRTIVH